MIKLLIGGSPCTHWSIAQSKNRETQAEGIGWELFRNYLFAKEKFQPDFFLYENNKSAAQPIKDQISKELGVDLMHINSALVSAQNRQRFYAFNWDVEQPEDRGILLRDILETAYPYKQTVTEKGYCLDANYWKTPGSPETFLEGGHARASRTMVAEPVGFTDDGKSFALTTRCVGAMPEDTLKRHRHTMVAEPVGIGTMPQNNGQMKDNQATRIYSEHGKFVTLSANGGGWGAKTGLYAVPVEPMIVKEATAKGYTEIEPGNCVDLAMPNSTTRRGRNMKEKCNCLTTGNQFYQYCGTIDKPIYEVKDGFITIKGKTYPIKLQDGCYIIRKLTPIECERLQTMPDNYTAAVSNAQRYKGLGNGWTAEVIIHILMGALKDVPKDEKIVVLSMYDGIGTGRYCLDKMGFTNVEYHAYEIDKYAMKIAMSNYPDIIQHGDAFAVRDDGWHI